MSVDYPWVLVLLVACLPPLSGAAARTSSVSALTCVPTDGLSRTIDLMLRLLAAGAVAATVCGLAGLHRGAGTIERTGRGAHILLVLDRSLSMDEGLALTGQKAHMSKTAAATHLIEAFFARRPHDSFGLVAFSTQPIPDMPLTEHREAMAAAMSAMRQKALANTDIGAGLEAALAMFKSDDPLASRVILFVSDGAGRIPDGVQADLRIKMLLQRIHLYYLYLRSGDSPALSGDVSGRSDLTQPAALHAFFRSLGIPYRGFEASDPGAIAAATEAIGRLENQPVTYHETVPRVGYEGLCYASAAVFLLIVLLSRLAERDFGGVERRT
jgi:mxaC protein